MHSVSPKRHLRRLDAERYYTISKTAQQIKIPKIRNMEELTCITVKHSILLFIIETGDSFLTKTNFLCTAFFYSVNKVRIFFTLALSRKNLRYLIDVVRLRTAVIQSNLMNSFISMRSYTNDLHSLIELVYLMQLHQNKTVYMLNQGATISHCAGSIMKPIKWILHILSGQTGTKSIVM